MGEWKKTQCTVCGVSCGLEVEVENNEIISSRADPDSPRSHGYACRKGRNTKFFMHHGDRLDYPMKRVNGELQRISWDQAILEIGNKLRAIVDQYGPRAVCGIGGASGGGQSELIFLKALINGLGGQYIFNPIGFEFLGNWWSHGKIYGDQVSFTEPDDTGCEVMVLWGSNSYVTHQMCDARKNIREASENPDKLLVVIDPRMSESARMADIHIANRPGTDAIMLKGLIALILRRGWENKEYCRKYVKDLDKIRPWFYTTNIEECFRVAGVTMEEMEKLAKIFTTRKWGVHQDLGIFCGRHSTLSSYLIIMLTVICGVAMVPGATITHELWATRGETIHEDTDPKVWRTPVTNRFPVLETFPSCVMPVEMLSDRPDRIRAAIRTLGSPMRSYPDSAMVEKAFKNLELLVVCDIAWTEDCEYADYVLPAKSALERYEFNAFQMNFPECVMALRPPVIDTIAERRDMCDVFVEIAKVSGAFPKIPKWLDDAADKAVKTGDRMPFLFAFLAYLGGTGMKYYQIRTGILGATLGRAWGSATKGVAWGALMTTPMAPGLCAKAGHPKLGFHPLMEKMPGLDNFCALDAAFEQVLKHPEGAVVGIADNDKPEEYLKQHVHHKDKKIHLYCDEIFEAVKNLTPEGEDEAVTPTEEFPLIMSSGRHTEDGLNSMTRYMKNMNRYHRSYYTFLMNPEDAAEQGFTDGQTVRVTTKGGSAEIPVEITHQVNRGYAMFPHHYGLKFEGEVEGVSGGQVFNWDNMDEITGNPCVRFTPCRVEAV